jgi:hypothetical protein
MKKKLKYKTRKKESQKANPEQKVSLKNQKAGNKNPKIVCRVTK